MKKRNHLGDLDVDERIILKRIQIYWSVWFEENGNLWLAHVNTVTNLLVT
jgi:hypothetical protein